jgi:NhaC family Na+:H+ antiporter
MTGVLGVSTLQYAPWAVFNYLNPVVAIAYALTGFRVERLPETAEDEPAPPIEPVDAVAAHPPVA